MENRETETPFSVSPFHLAARVHDCDAPVPFIIPLSSSSSFERRERERELRGLGHAVGSRDPTLLLSSCADRTRRWARARAAPRDHGRYAVDPRAAAAARNRVNAFSGRPPSFHFGRRPRAARDGGPLLTPLSLVVDRFIHDSARIRGGLAASRARSSRANVQRSLVRARQVRRRASSLRSLKRPSARRGPGIVSVDRNVRSKCRCSCVLQFTS